MDLLVRDVTIPLPEEQHFCEYCNAETVTIGYTKVRKELRITPIKEKRIIYKQEVVICPKCKEDGDGAIVKAVVPAALMAHSPASPSAAGGLTLPREAMANWYIHCAEDYFYPIYKRIHEHMLNRDILHAAKTTFQVLQEEGTPAESTSYVCIYLTGSDGLSPTVLYDYDYQPGRGRKYPQDFLKGFTRLLQCDGYQGYNKVEDVMLVCCLAHCRRKFYEVVPTGRRKKWKFLDINSQEAIKEPVFPVGEDIPEIIPAEIGLTYCNRMFFIKIELKGLPAKGRKTRCVKLETPI